MFLLNLIILPLATPHSDPVPDVLVLRGLELAHGDPGAGVTALPSVVITWSLLTQTE